MFAAAFAMLVLALFAALLMVLCERRQQAATERATAARATRPLAPVSLS